MNNKMEMQCSPKCKFFPDMGCSEWEYDKEIAYVKRRKEKREFRCVYDGHVITNWYTPCPKKLDEFLRESEENNHD